MLLLLLRRISENASELNREERKQCGQPSCIALNDLRTELGDSSSVHPSNRVPLIKEVEPYGRGLDFA
jgi:hypothetical protein